MRIIRDFQSCPPESRNAAVALGNFDGVHLGHQSILNKAVSLAETENIPSAVMTFEPHPREFFAKDGKRLRISSFHDKVELFAGLGINTLFLVRFNARFASLSPTAFVDEVLCRELGVRHVVTGYNFAFGKGRAGDTAFLEAQAQQKGFGFTACPAVYSARGEAISSSAIRGFLTAGEVKKASALLGRPYTISGIVRRGQRNGHKLGFPTANVSLRNLFTPRYGVYAVRFRIADDKGWHNGVANLGIKPTFGHTEPLLEVHGFDMNRDLYGQRISVELVEFIREERRFDGMEAVQIQIAADCGQARKILQGNI